MKKFLKISLAMLLISTTMLNTNFVFANNNYDETEQVISAENLNAEDNQIVDVEIISQTTDVYSSDYDEKNVETIPTLQRAPATQVSSVQYIKDSAGFDKSGNVCVNYLVMGYGKCTTKINGVLNSDPNYTWYDTVGRNPVYGYYNKFNLGKLSKGTHNIVVTAHSYNYPYTTISSTTLKLTIS